MVDEPEDDLDMEIDADSSDDYEDDTPTRKSGSAEARRRIEDLKDKKLMDELLNDDDYWAL